MAIYRKLNPQIGVYTVFTSIHERLWKLKDTHKKGYLSTVLSVKKV